MAKWSPEIQAMIDRYGEEKAYQIIRLQMGIVTSRTPSRLFVPNRGQWRVAEVLDRDHIPFHMNFLAGNGVGKTCWLVQILIGLAWGRKFLNPEWLGRLKVWDRLKDVKNIRLVCHADDMKEGGSLYDEIIKWFPKGAYQINKDGKLYYSVIKCSSGVNISVRTHDQSVIAHAGPNMDVILANEPMPQHLFGENCGRLRNTKHPMFWFFMTPLSVSAWLHEVMVEGEDDYDTVLVEASIWDNCKDIPGTRGVLRKEVIDQIVDKWRKEDPEQAEARITGKFQHLSGRIFKIFDRAVHVIDPFEIPENWALSYVMDPHDSRPPFVTFWAQDPMNNLYCIGEYPRDTYHLMKDDRGMSYDNHVANIKNIMEQIAPNRAWAWTDAVMDPNKGETKSGPDAQTIRSEYAKRGLRCRTNVNDDLDYGHKAIQSRLYFDRERFNAEGEITADNRPKLFFFSTCKNTHSAMNKYGYKPESQQKGSSMTSRIDQTFKDPVDTVRYRVVSIRAYANPKNSRNGSDMQAISRGRAKAYGG